MDNLIRKDIHAILTKVNRALENNDIRYISEISDQINHNASIFQDEDSLTLAVSVYAVSKVLEGSMNKKANRSFIALFKRAKSCLEVGDYSGYRENIKKVTERIKESDATIRRYVLQAYNQAGIKKGSKIFSNGISLPRVAEILGLSQWELVNYISKTNIADNFDPDKRLSERIKYAKSLFNIGHIQKEGGSPK